MIKPLNDLWDKVNSLYNWVLDGSPKKAPFSGYFVSARRERWQTVFLEGVSAAYSFIYTLLFEAFAIPVEFVVGVFSQLCHSDRKHTQHFVGGIVSLLSSICWGIIDILRWFVELAVSLWKSR